MDLLALLRDGELSLEGRLTTASNTTLLAWAEAGDRAGERRVRCVYKPIAGEAPLWDFPDGSLAGREVAAYEVSEAAGWHLVPPTVFRSDGPHGPGMAQAWVEQAATTVTRVDVVALDAVPSGWHPVLRAEDGDGLPVVLVHSDDDELRRLALFDVVVNNADRKGGHVLDGDATLEPSMARIVGVDHGVSFHVEPKLRTVLWGWADQPLTEVERTELTALAGRLDGDLGERLTSFVRPEEVAATRQRVADLLERGALPMPTGRMPVPWPLF